MDTLEPPASIWHVTAPEIATDHALPRRADVVIVGAGLTGLSLALMLARAGATPLVIEASHVGALTTGGTTGKLSLLQGSSFSSIRSHAGLTRLQSYLAANRAGVKWLADELDDVPDAAERRPAYTFASTASGVRSLDAEAAACAAVGLDIQQRGTSSGDEVGLPFAIEGSLRLDDQVQVHPLHMLKALADRARDAGAVIVEDCRLLTTDASASEVWLETTRGRISAERLVLATGMPVLDRSLGFAALAPTRELVGAYRLPTPAPRGMYLSVDPVTRSLRTASDAEGAEVLIVGGDSFTPGRAANTAARVGELDAWVAGRFGAATRSTWWGAQDYVAPAHLPSVGPIAGGHDRIFAASGYAKWGMSNAIAASMTIAGEFGGQRPEWADAYSGPTVTARSIAELVRHNAEVAGWYVRGWAGALTRPEPVEAKTRRLATDPPAVRRTGTHPVAQAPTPSGICRVSGVCTHLGGILQWNTAERSWDCPLHGSRFTTDGAVIEGPATRPLPRAD